MEKTSLILILFAFLLGNCYSNWVDPEFSPREPSDYMVHPMNLSDYILTEEELEDRNLNVGRRLNWKNGIFFFLDGAFSQSEKQLINRVLFELKDITCIKVRIWESSQRPNTEAYVFIRKGNDYSCHSFIGRHSQQPQILHLGQNCLNYQTILHEVLHSYGLVHEHQRSDRDQFINIHWNNIRRDKFNDFEKISTSSLMGFPYDYQSVMHYDEYAFSKNNYQTISSKTRVGVRRIGSIGRLTNLDKLKIKKLYNCS